MSTPPSLDPASQRRRFKRRLLKWFRTHGRDLPWRRTRDPYRVLVSEIMLQQTQVSRVEGYWHDFLRRFPTLEALAQARPRSVREAWSGLGYYRRATNLHRLARDVVREQGGTLPDDIDALRALPGIGPYTAGAVASFAFERNAPAIDTNVGRVLRRVFHPRTKDNATGRRRLEATARALVPRPGADAWITNQALMELGALVCTARIMRCDRCPVRPACRTGAQAVTPAITSTARARSRGST
ncbi:MAG: A/G-specific adenine glycosylase [Gemmatimonadota bacterium]